MITPEEQPLHKYFPVSSFIHGDFTKQKEIDITDLSNLENEFSSNMFSLLLTLFLDLLLWSIVLIAFVVVAPFVIIIKGAFFVSNTLQPSTIPIKNQQ